MGVGAKITQEMMLEAIKNTQGLVSKIQRKLESALGEKVSWDTTLKYVQKWQSCVDAVKAEKEAMLDLAENAVYKELSDGDVRTAKWYLKMKGKERGYVETQEIQMANTDPLNINLTGNTMTPEELAASADVEITGGDGE